MAEINTFIEDLIEQQRQMTSLLINLKKMGKGKFTTSTLNTRLTNLNIMWTKCQEIHTAIRRASTAEQKKSLPYFTEDQISKVEATYYEVSDYIVDVLNPRITAINANSTATGHSLLHDGTHTSFTPLPKINMPTFSGNYNDWISFRDLFQSLVINNESLPDVQRLHYLKTSVTGEASSLLKSVPVTEANFKLAWDTLKERYENSRHIINAYLTKLFDVNTVTTENVKDLKRLRDQTHEAVGSLGNLGRPIDQWDDLLTFMTVRKLDPVSRREWEMRIGETTTFPTYEEIHKFLEYRVRALEAIAPPSSKKNLNKSKDNDNSVKSHVSSVPKSCECEEDHPLRLCEIFKAKSVEERLKHVQKQKLCHNCLYIGHPTNQCRSKYTCSHCKKRHHTMLHNSNAKEKSEKLAFSPGGGTIAKPAPVNTSSPIQTASTSTPVQSSTSQHVAAAAEALHAAKSKISPATVMLATAWVLVSSNKGRQTKVRALLDQGSQSSFVTEAIAQTLRASRTKVRTAITGIGGTDAGTGRAIITLTLKSCIGTNESVQCSAIVFQKLTSYVPQRSLCQASWRHLEGLEIADPDPSGVQPIQLILGADVYANILREGLKRGPIGSPIAQKTTLGWILSGPTSGNSNQSTTLTANLACDNSDLISELRRFWELEEVPTSKPLSTEETACEAHFAATHKRVPEGRYGVKLPFKTTTPINIGSSSQIAKDWLAKLQRKFIRNPDILEPYYDFMTEYIRLKHMTPTTFDAPDSNPALYLSHHAVFKDSSTTRLRVVFNASSKTSNGTSLNDHLMVGPKLQSDLPTTILRWRQHQYALTADIEKMYRQILIDPEDTRYQQILWRPTPESPIVPYKLVTVTYGTASAPYLAMRVLKQLADDEAKDFPSAAAIARDNFYVDDVLFGANDEATANALRHELEQLLERGGLKLRKWMSSHSSLLADVPESDQEKTKTRQFDSTEAVKILGIRWVPNRDSFCFNVTAPKRAKNTKRSVLSITAQLFDPLGWLSPVIVTAKILMQELWIASVDWDDELKEDTSERWDDYCRKLPELEAIAVPQWNHLTSNENECELHGFADASTRAYAAVVYLRIITSEGESKVTLLTGKSKVAPIKTVSVPRLELCAAVLLAKLIDFVKRAMHLQHCTTYAWSDSSVVLAWLQQHPSTWPTFVANRVATIQHRLQDVSWRHVPTAQNPADCASRGLNATELCTHHLWWQGPPWLKYSEAKWPHSSPKPPKSELVEASLLPTKIHVAVDTILHWELYTEISSWNKLVRVTAYCMRFIERCQQRSKATELRLSGDEIRKAQTFWINDIQRQHYRDEIQSIKEEKPLPRNSPLRSLTPFVDEKGTIRVGGRLERSNLTFEEKHPAILPKHRVSTLIVEDAHLRCLHGSPQLTISILRQRYWIVGHRPFVRNIINKCVPCVRERAKVPQQIMGNLPAARSNQHRAFLHTGLDYAGPFLVRISKGRGCKSHKAYLALFVCTSTRAIHLEIVSDYSSDAFLAAYRRFIARRGLPLDMYSDNGTTFQGAEKELQTAFKNAMDDSNLGNIIANDGTNWHFIPPGAPHFGGLWEAGVKCAKHHLKRVLGTHTLTYEEFNTLITQVEACLNSRPIGPNLTDPCEFAALTPGHFVVGAPLISVPEPSSLHLHVNRLSRWQLVQQMLKSFWKRWSTEYFHSLQIRTKWKTTQQNIAVGNLVLIRNNLAPPSKWMLGRVVETHPGSDSRVRVVSVRTATTQLKRPITQLYLLPVDTTKPDVLINPPSDTPTSTDSTEFQDCETVEQSQTTDTDDSDIQVP